MDLPITQHLIRKSPQTLRPQQKGKKVVPIPFPSVIANQEKRTEFAIAKQTRQIARDNLRDTKTQCQATWLDDEFDEDEFDYDEMYREYWFEDEDDDDGYGYANPHLVINMGYDSEIERDAGYWSDCDVDCFGDCDADDSGYDSY
jgi:hypothetical protein